MNLTNTLRPGWISRRDFCRQGLGALSGVAAARLLSAESTQDAGFDLVGFERPRVLAAAKQYLHEQPITLTNFSSPRSAGGKHDYFSEADYWWPDPKDPKGPYVQRDGMSNPDNFTGHRHALIRMAVQVSALAAAWVLTRERRYADHAVEHLRAWFLNPKTLMNPTLQYAQAIHGRTTGRGTGIIDTIHLVEVVRSITFLADSRALKLTDLEGLRKWFVQYL
ncbi:MAG TPA: alginate lyase family protein, partial [Terriglobales bacterium]|nr:alginate lyase family protein [Terriglobales bacterium]